MFGKAMPRRTRLFRPLSLFAEARGEAMRR